MLASAAGKGCNEAGRAAGQSLHTTSSPGCTGRAELWVQGAAPGPGEAQPRTSTALRLQQLHIRRDATTGPSFPAPLVHFSVPSDPTPGQLSKLCRLVVTGATCTAPHSAAVRMHGFGHKTKTIYASHCCLLPRLREPLPGTNLMCHCISAAHFCSLAGGG